MPRVDVGSDPEYTEDACGEGSAAEGNQVLPRGSNPGRPCPGHCDHFSGDTGLPQETREQGGRGCQPIRLQMGPGMGQEGWEVKEDGWGPKASTTTFYLSSQD